METKRLITALLAFIIISLAWTCTELAEDKSLTHPNGWADPSDPLFHGLKVDESGLEFCATCHGADYSGGETGVACAGCHASFPHPEDFLKPDSTGFHGAYLAANAFDLSECQDCHGEDYLGGTSGVACTLCHTIYPHPADFGNSATTGYHGDVLAANDYNLAQCESCHGSDYLGGTTSISCYTCHEMFPHADGWTTPASEDFHAKYLDGIDFDLTKCQACHGTDFGGGNTGYACNLCHTEFPHASGWTTPASDDFHGKHLYGLWYDMDDCADCHGSDLAGGDYARSCSNTTCHEQAAGVYACDNCHSYIDDAEFTDLQGNTDPTIATVGVHTSHYLGSHGLTNNVSCSSCHIVPTSFADITHIDATKYAEVTFDTTKFITNLGSGAPAWSWDRTTRTCDNIYCHGNFAYGTSGAITGNDSTWTWNVPSAGNLCGTCHNLPPEGHFSTTSNCGACHTSVADPNENIIIEAGRDLHINGLKNQP